MNEDAKLMLFGMGVTFISGLAIGWCARVYWVWGVALFGS